MIFVLNLEISKFNNKNNNKNYKKNQKLQTKN